MPLEALAGCTPRPVGESEEYAAVIRAAENNLESYSVALQGKTLYSALYGNYTVTLNELKSVQNLAARQDSRNKETASRRSAAGNDNPLRRQPAHRRK
jgi:hypothetical protein